MDWLIGIFGVIYLILTIVGSIAAYYRVVRNGPLDGYGRASSWSRFTSSVLLGALFGWFLVPCVIYFYIRVGIGRLYLWWTKGGWW